MDQLPIRDADVFLTRLTLDDSLFSTLRDTTPWEQRQVTVYGRTINQPRLTAWYGDAPYSYAGTHHDPLPWTPTLQQLRDGFARFDIGSFNSVLLNYYRDGRDSIGFHSDDEDELGPEPLIASLSIGDPRTFVFRHKMAKYPDYGVVLEHGSLLIMAGTTQLHWKHGINKVKNAGPRINLTFRTMLIP